MSMDSDNPTTNTNASNHHNKLLTDIQEELANQLHPYQSHDSNEEDLEKVNHDKILWNGGVTSSKFTHRFILFMYILQL